MAMIEFHSMVAKICCQFHLKWVSIKFNLNCSLMELEATRDEILFEVHQQKIEDGLDFLESEVTFLKMFVMCSDSTPYSERRTYTKYSRVFEF